ncbi:putative PEP-binding protein [Paenibacillus sp. GCM10028914]|uniref:putative PEP-binding protein n=1 Tax=Paenibacillus sp. GCM10028914 TaxID=3273416 RepID=UPI00361D62A6
MTEAKRGNGTELGKRLYDMFRSDRERPAGNTAGKDLLGELAVTGGVTHEEALLLLASPEDIEELVRKKEVSGKDQSSLQRLLQWSDEKRNLKVLMQANSSEQAAVGMRRGAQGIGLMRGEAILYTNSRLKKIYHDWLESQDEMDKQHYRFRLISLWTEEWVSVLQAANGALCSISLVWDTAATCSPQARHDIQDIQLESLYRAVFRCHEEGLECRLELLALWPQDSADFTEAQDFIEEVGKQTLSYLKTSVNLKIGALLHPEIDPKDAADIARLADVIVMDTESADKLHFLDEGRSIRTARNRIELDEPITEWASPDLLQSNLEETVLRIWQVKPHIAIRVSREVTVSDLRTVYRLGISEVCCEVSSLAAVRLAGMRLEWMLSRLPTAGEA